MNILDRIVEKRQKRIQEAKNKFTLNQMRQIAEQSNEREPFAFERAMKKTDLSFILEVKKASPSKGVLVQKFPYMEITKEYEEIGASAISVLTEPDFFQGDIEFLREIRKQVSIPLLRKDFIIDEYQIYEAKVVEADAILLICSILDQTQLENYLQLANELGLSVLVEAHNESEVALAVQSHAKMIGINNRNLKDFSVHLDTTGKLRTYIPDDVIKISESGIHTREDIAYLQEQKVDGVLIGETMMLAKDRKRKMLELQGKDYE